MSIHCRLACGHGIFKRKERRRNEFGIRPADCGRRKTGSRVARKRCEADAAPPTAPAPPAPPPVVGAEPPLKALPLDWALADRVNPRIKIARPRSRFIGSSLSLLQNDSRNHPARSVLAGFHTYLPRIQWISSATIGGNAQSHPREAKSKLICGQSRAALIRVAYQDYRNEYGVRFGD